MSGDYSPKVGDRVKATRVIVGVIVDANAAYTRIRHDGDSGRHTEVYDEHYTWEKLADPEPEWVNGDVIEVVYDQGGRYEQLRRLVRIGGRWTHIDTGEQAGAWFMRNHWPQVKILYKADAEVAS